MAPTETPSVTINLIVNEEELKMNKILLVTDDDAMGLLFEDELIGEGYDVARSNHLSDVLENIDKVRPDLLIIDSRLSADLNYIHRIGMEYLNLPVLVSSPFAGNLEMTEFSGSSLTGFLSFDLKELKTVIEKARKGKRNTPDILKGKTDVNERLYSGFEQMELTFH